jgi:hypothetical protein
MCRGKYNKNSKMQCVISVRFFKIILKFYIFLVAIGIGPQVERCSYGMAGGCFTDVMLHSSKNYHSEHATEPRRLPKTVVAVWGAKILRFHGVANLYICR